MSSLTPSNKKSNSVSLDVATAQRLAQRLIASPASDKGYMPSRATLVSDLATPYTNKVTHSLSKGEREVDKLNRILELER